MSAFVVLPSGSDVKEAPLETLCLLSLSTHILSERQHLHKVVWR